MQLSGNGKFSAIQNCTCVGKSCTRRNEVTFNATLSLPHLENSLIGMWHFTPHRRPAIPSALLIGGHNPLTLASIVSLEQRPQLNSCSVLLCITSCNHTARADEWDYGCA